MTWSLREKRRVWDTHCTRLEFTILQIIFILVKTILAPLERLAFCQCLKLSANSVLLQLYSIVCKFCVFTGCYCSQPKWTNTLILFLKGRCSFRWIEGIRDQRHHAWQHAIMQDDYWHFVWCDHAKTKKSINFLQV